MLAYLVPVLYFLLFLMSVFLILVILVQRGRGGGLAGALGGMGGSSAFGTKSGDVFTYITAGCFAVWLGMNLLLNWLMADNRVFVGGAEAGQQIAAPEDPAKILDAGDPEEKATGGASGDGAGAKQAVSKEAKSSEKSAPVEDSKSEAPKTDAKTETKQETPKS